MTSTTTERGIDRLRESFARFEERRPYDPAWLRELRRSAFARFAALGFPTAKHEDWRSTSVARIASGSWTPASEAPATVSGLGRLFAGAAPRTRLVFVNGLFARELSTLRRESAATVLSFRDAIAGDHAAPLREHLGRLVPAASAFGALGGAFLEDGALVHVPDGRRVDGPIEVVFITASPEERIAVVPRLLVVLGRDARATLLERFLAPLDDSYFANAVTEVVLGEGASLDHVRLVQESEAASRVALLAVEQERASRLASRTLTLGGALVREDARVVLGEGAECALDGLAVLTGDEHADASTRIEHAGPRAKSRQEHRSIVEEHARSVFRGRIVVAPDAQRTVAEQSSRSLLLSDDAIAEASPELEIHADDVKCAHGAAVGRLNEDALFYLRSRGIDAGAARAVLTYAFASELVERAPGPLRALLEDAVRARLCPGERHLRSLGRQRTEAP